MTYADMNLFENEQLKRPYFDQIITYESMRNAYKLTGEILKYDPYIELCNSIIETAERLYMLQDYCQTNAFNQNQACTGHE